MRCFYTLCLMMHTTVSHSHSPIYFGKCMCISLFVFFSHQSTHFCTRNLICFVLAFSPCTQSSVIIELQPPGYHHPSHCSIDIKLRLSHHQCYNHRAVQHHLGTNSLCSRKTGFSTTGKQSLMARAAHHGEFV